MSALENEMKQTAYEILLNENPRIIDRLRELLEEGQTAKQIEKRLSKTKNVISDLAIQAAYYMEGK